jgi:3-hydroxyacyl-CoA dehydrogenase/enoyl-CoA hydratase/3-hydroxybutyryl-CoA epimerase
MSRAWTIEIDPQRIAWLTFDLPGEKVNKLTAAALRELAEMLEEIPTDTRKRVLVVRSGKPGCFIVGADIDELSRIESPGDARSKAAAGQEIFERLAGLRVPTVALIDGPCLGGGLELALACSYRLATDSPRTSLGLPEVGLGIIPGWGGTQRLPRLVGLPRALSMIASGKPLDARGAWRAGLVDGIVAPEFAAEQARRFIEGIQEAPGAAAVQTRRRRCRGRMMRLLSAAGPGRALLFRRALREVRRRTQGQYPAPLRAIDVLRRTVSNRSVEEGLPVEAEAFSELACTPISRHLLWLFRAGQRARRSGTAAPRIERAGVVGAGIMGSGIAWALARCGIEVRLKDVDWDAVARGMSAAAEMFQALVRRGSMTRAQMNLAMHRLAPSVDYTGFRRAGIVIEAVSEDLELKTRVLSEIERHAGPDTIIATNTSSLPLEALASALQRPQRFCAMHFFNPVNRMGLVEVVPAPQTDPQTIAAATELVRRMDKTPLVVGNCAGFLVNRILLPYLIESAWMFEEGCAIRRIDEALERFGMPMGPLKLVDEVGIDVGYKVAKVLEGAYGERMRVPGALRAVAAGDGLLGRKSGRGFYRYRNGSARPNRQVARVARQARRADGVAGRSLGEEDIVDRAILIMVNEAARCLEEGVVESPEALDLAMVMGTGFAPFRGGLLRYADERGLPEIRRRLEGLAETYGERFRAAPLIERMAGGDGCFHGEQTGVVPAEGPRGAPGASPGPEVAPTINGLQKGHAEPGPRVAAPTRTSP